MSFTKASALLCAATTIVVATMPTSARADTLLGSFENSLSGPLGNWTLPGTVNYSATGATDGAVSAAITPPVGFNWSIALNGNEPLRDAILANDKIAFDVTITQAYTPGVAEYVVFLASFNSNSTGWQQAGSNLLSPGGENALGQTKQTFVWDYPNNVVNAASPWSQFNIATNFGPSSGTAPTIFIDNVRLIAVPEPAALATLASAGTLLFRRRRSA